MDNAKPKELWDRLENEARRAFEAFQTFLSLPADGRTIVEAYRYHVGNPHVAKPSDTWIRWSSEFAWRERAAAYDDHVTSKRREAYERGLEEEAERQGVIAERNRNRTNELMTVSYEKAMDWFENTDPSDLRAQDVLQIIKLHLEAVKTFGAAEGPKEEEGWTEEDDAYLVETILPQIEGEQAHEGPEEGSVEGEENSEGVEGDCD